MSEAQGENVIRESIEDDWKIALFQEAEADLRWAKERQTQFVQWALFIFAGLVALSNGPGLDSGILVWIVGIVSLAAIAWVSDLHGFENKTRESVPGLLPDGYCQLELGFRKLG